MNVEEPLPISAYYEVVSHIDLFKGSKWWGSVVLYRRPGGRRCEIGLYLWVKKETQWKRKNKFVIRNRGDWLLIRESVDKLILKIDAPHEAKSS
jgi:hypothetical protein